MLRILVLFLIFGQIYSKPNVLFIMVDDLRPALGVYGDENAYTPNIDKLADRSVVFTHAYAQQALCAPSRNSLLTSRRPNTLHLYDFYSYWRNTVGNFTTLPQHFRENGYFTQSIGKVFHPGISSNFTDDAKYSWSDEPFHPKTEDFKEAKVCPSADGKLARNLLCPVIVEHQPEEILPDMESLNAAVSFLRNYDTKKNDKPFFLAVGFHKPHIPFKFPLDYLDFHPLEEIKLPANHQRPSLLPTVAWNPWTDIRRRDDIAALNVSFPFGPMPDDIARKIIQHYHTSVTYIDDLIGQLLEEVDDNTIIVLTSDHGWSMGEHGEFSKYSNFEVAVRVPLMIHVPRLMTNTLPVFSNGLTELVDIFPTLVDLTGITTMPLCSENSSQIILCSEGESLVPLIMAEIKNNRKKASDMGKYAVFNQYPRPGLYPTHSPNSDKPRLNQIQTMGYSVRTARYRYTEWVHFNNKRFKPSWSELYASELYDHLIDPDENMNLAGKKELSYITAHLSALLRINFSSKK